MSAETIRKDAVNWMFELARDDSHGYDQNKRWGERGDYDCSSAVITAYEMAGVPVKTDGATYTGNMREVFLRNGFKNVTASVNLKTGAGLMEGDVLLNIVNHTAMYIGDGLEAEASINEFGGVRGGQPGDQTGREILVRTYRNYPWDCVLRYEGDECEKVVEEASKDTFSFEVEEVSIGSCGKCVRLLQTLLKGLGFLGRNAKELNIDADFGPNTQYAVTSFQYMWGLKVDGIVGNDTWEALLSL